MATMTAQQRAEIRKKALKHLKKSGSDTAYVPLDDNTRPDIDVISSGSIVLDKVLGCGGWPRGRVVEIFGPESVGKSTLAIAACIEAQKHGGHATYIDFEHALHLGYAQACGLDISEERFSFFQPDHFEMGANIAYTYTKLVQSDIVVIDSVSAMIPRAVFEGQPDEGSKGLGLQARLMSTFLNQITKEIAKSGTVLCFINQMRSNIKTSKYQAGPDWTTSGGKSLPYYCTIRLRLKPGKVEYANIMNDLTGEKEKIPISNFVRAEGHKNKVGFPKRKGEFVIRYGEGIDNCRSIIEVAERHKIIRKDGSWYRYGNDGDQHYFRRQGVEQFRKYLQNRPEMFAAITAEVSSAITTDQISKINQDIGDDELEVEDRKEQNLDLDLSGQSSTSSTSTVDDVEIDTDDLVQTDDSEGGSDDGLLPLEAIESVVG